MTEVCLIENQSKLNKWWQNEKKKADIQKMICYVHKQEAHLVTALLSKCTRYEKDRHRCLIKNLLIYGNGNAKSNLFLVAPLTLEPTHTANT